MDSSNDDVVSYSKVPYQYRPLTKPQEIRLVLVQPGKWDDNIVCQLIHYTGLAEETSQLYWALSYTWGDPRDTRCVQCDTDGSGINVTKNCWDALRRIRKADGGAVAWIDAICINQGDVAERNSQVRMMDTIYRRAAWVWIYLGEEAQDSAFVMDLMYCAPEDWKHRFDRPLTDREIEGVAALLRRPWFSRVWVIQEVALCSGATILCGDRRVVWKYFHEICNFFFVPALAKGGSLRDLKLPYVVRHGMDLLRDDLLPFLLDTRECGATDARDKVFALTGITKFMKSDDVQIDYDQPGIELYADVARYFIIRDQNLNVLAGVQGESKLKGLPSWVPDWSNQSKVEPLGQPHRRWYRANEDGIDSVAFLPDKVENEAFVLKVKGVRVDVIEHLSGLFNYDNFLEQDLQAWLELSNDMIRRPAETTEQAFWQTLVAGASEMFTDDDDPWSPDAYRSWLQHHEIELRSTSGGTTQLSTKQLANAQVFRDRVEQSCTGRKLYRTKSGFVGLAPSQSCAGDSLCLLAGGRTAYILRVVDEFHHVLVGEAYAHGLMDGQVNFATAELEYFCII